MYEDEGRKKNITFNCNLTFITRRGKRERRIYHFIRSFYLNKSIDITPVTMDKMKQEEKNQYNNNYV